MSFESLYMGLILIRIQLVLLQEKLERHNKELKNKISVIQQDLGNSEAVQKDFVRLSQSLQVRQQQLNSFE